MAKKLLLVDSNLAVQKLVEHSLGRGEYEVTCLRDGLSALDILDKLDPDLILADFNVEGINIFRFCDKLRQKSSARPRPLLLLVGTAEPVDANRLRAAGVTDFVKKPLDASELIEKVKNFSIEPATQVHHPRAAIGPTPARTETVARSADEADAARIEELLGWSQPGTSARPPAPDEDDRTIVQPVQRPTATRPAAAAGPGETAEKPPLAGARVEPTRTQPNADLPAPVAAVDGATAGATPEALQALARQVAREVIEKVAWEVVPQLAEALIKEEIEKLKNAIPPED